MIATIDTIDQQLNTINTVVCYEMQWFSQVTQSGIKGQSERFFCDDDSFAGIVPHWLRRYKVA